MHIKDSHEIKIPPSSAIQCVCSNVLFARRFMHITLTTNKVTTVDGMLLNKIEVSSFTFFKFEVKALINPPNKFYVDIEPSATS
jgi:hypothetical protein